MAPAQTPLKVDVYQDVLCAWCSIATSRLDALRGELGTLVAWSTRPFALRLKDSYPDEQERTAWISELDRAREEPEGRGFSTALWSQGDPPSSSILPLVALEAARLQSPSAAAELTEGLRRAALEHGVNVSRTDVLLELAHRTRLDVDRFSSDLATPDMHRRIRRLSRSAARRGVTGVPTLVIDGRWMVSGLRTREEYRELLVDCLERKARERSGLGSPTLH